MEKNRPQGERRGGGPDQSRRGVTVHSNSPIPKIEGAVEKRKCLISRREVHTGLKRKSQVHEKNDADIVWGEDRFEEGAKRRESPREREGARHLATRRERQKTPRVDRKKKKHCTNEKELEKVFSSSEGKTQGEFPPPMKTPTRKN